MEQLNQELMRELAGKFDDSPTMEEWLRKNIPDDDLIWKRGPGSQGKLFNAVHTIIRLPSEVPEPRVVGHHTSKSVRLPVALYKLDFFREPKAYVMVRNNFYDTKVGVVANCPIDIPYNLTFVECSQEWYDKEKQRKLGYVEDEGSPLYETDEWYENGWSGGQLIRDEENRIWRTSSVQEVYCEGMGSIVQNNEFYKPYAKNKSMFMACIGSYIRLAQLIDGVWDSLERTQSRESSKPGYGQDD